MPDVAINAYYLNRFYCPREAFLKVQACNESHLYTKVIKSWRGKGVLGNAVAHYGDIGRHSSYLCSPNGFRRRQVRKDLQLLRDKLAFESSEYL